MENYYPSKKRSQVVDCKTESNFTRNFTERRDLGKKGLPYKKKLARFYVNATLKQDCSPNLTRFGVRQHQTVP